MAPRQQDDGLTDAAQERKYANADKRSWLVAQRRIAEAQAADFDVSYWNPAFNGLCYGLR
jgi:hypothetical protein